MGIGTGNHPGRILLVEDSRTQRLLVEAKLREEGHEVVEAGNGKEALDAVAREEPGYFDLVISDIMMPEMDGISLLRQIRARFSRIELPVIVATGKDRSEDVVAGLQAGANDYVAKPVDLAVLLARVDTQLSLKRAHAALHDAQRALIRAARMESVGILAAGVAHEIRNPLAMMSMVANGLRTRLGGADPESAALLDTLVESIGRADRIVKDLMRASQAQQLKLAPGDVNELVQGALAMLSEEIERNRLRLRLCLASGLPPALVARHDLRQALVNVLLNAIQAMPQGGELFVETRLQEVVGLDAETGRRTGNRLRNGEQAVLIRVEDTGPGIPPEFLGKIFDPFFTTKAPGLGMGLGLTVARQLVSLHHGLLRVTNREDGQGARSEIFLKRPDVLLTSI